MPIVTRHSLTTIAVLAVVALLGISIFIWSGIYNIGADDTHTRPVYSVLQALREQSIAARAKKLQLPDLTDPARIKQGAGNYNAMCAGCHLGPGMVETELSKGLYPTPPDLTQHMVDPRKAFWVIKHGIKASGMPAWGKSMEDEYIWNMAAFLQELPKLSAEQYQALVASSGGHSHGGGESGGHSQAAGASGHHEEGEGEGEDHAAMGHDPSSEAPGHDDKPAVQGTTHIHADGKQHIHAPESEATSATKPAATTPAKPTDEHAGMTMPEPAQPEHADDGHQH